MPFFATVALAALALVTGCDGLGASSEPPPAVVEAYFVAGESLGTVRLSRTGDIDEVYDHGALAIRDAEVAVERLETGGTVSERFGYVHDRDGVYQAVDEAAVVEPETTYRLSATLPDGSVLTSDTTVPGAFEIRRVNATSVEYQSSEQFEVDVTRSASPGRQTIFVFSIAALEPFEANLTPVYEDLISVDDLEEIRVTESPPISEENYDENDDGTLTIRLPWLAVAFYGPNDVSANAIDDNLYDFLRSQLVQQGGSTFAPGEIPNLLDRVDGGAGVFGSLARVTARVEIERPTSR